jgi:hypothetical protein
MRGRKQGTELAELEAGLGAAEDPYMIKDLVMLPTEDLVAQVQREIRYSAFSMLRAGRIFMAIKQQIRSRGNRWEDFVEQQTWSWDYVRCSMKFIEVVAKFPQALHLPSGRVLNRILHLPAPEIESIFTELPKEAIETLTPWDLQKLYTKKKLEKPKNKKPTRDIDTEVTVEPVDTLVAKVEGLLHEIAELDLTRSDSAKLDGYRVAITRALDQAAYNLKDPTHQSKPWWEMDPMHDDVSEDSTT